MTRSMGFGSAVVLALFVSSTRPAAADDAYTVAYGHHMEEGEVEVMFMQDVTAPSRVRRERDGQGEYLSQMLEIGYYPTRRLALEFMPEGFQDVVTGDARFTGFRVESRYRLFEREVPLNPTLYLEYEDLDPETRFKMEVSGWVLPPYAEKTGPEPVRERILESRLVLSQDVGSWNFAFNSIHESDLDAGETAFGYAAGASCWLGARHSAHDGHSGHAGSANDAPSVRPAALAFEFYGGLGDSIRFGLTPARQEHYFQPSLMFHLGENQMINVGFAIGLTESSDDLIRLGWGVSF